MQLPFRSTLSCLFGLLLLATFGAGYVNSQTFSATGSMAEPAVCQTATQLQNGTILIAGGANDAGILKSAEIYNPYPGGQTFSPTGLMNFARGCNNDGETGSTATLLNDGTVLIAGGSGNTTAELYFPSSGTFSLRTPPTPTNPDGLPIGAMNAVRFAATATLLQNGTVLITGGDTGNNAGLTSAEIYNPATGTFTAITAQMHTRRTTHTATLLLNGTVLIAGGQGNYSRQTAWNTAEIYNPSAQTFTLVGNMTTARCQHTATLLTDGTVLIAGGNGNSGALSSAEIYTPSASSFAATGSMNVSRFEPIATLLADGTVLVAGSNGSTAEIYDPSQHSFTLTGNMTVGLDFAEPAMTMLYNGDILIAGGDTEPCCGSILSSAQLYSYPVTVTTMNPAYKVTSIIYAPPGNKSQDGFTNTTTNSTTTTIGSNFSQGSNSSSALSVSMNVGIGPFSLGAGVTASNSFATSSTSTSSAAFQETYQNATGVANQSNSSASDAINHNNDLFLIWLNPQISVYGNPSAPVGYNVGVQPLANGTVTLPDIVEVFASAMEANSAGVTTVPYAILNQQNTAQGYQPGLASICKNLIAAEYNPPSGPPSKCTLADQCGCTPADFLPILQTDPLLFQNGLTNPVSPYPGTVSPLMANTSNGSQSDALCGTLPTPNLTGSDCRYVPVPETKGSATQADPYLSGPNTPNGNNSPNSFTQGENAQTTYTLGGQTQLTVGQSLSFTSGVTGSGKFGGLPGTPTSPPVPPCCSGGGTGNFQWGLGSTMQWTDIQSVGTASGSGVSLSVSLNSGSTYCGEYAPIFEDTIYHTFVFQELSNGSCTALAPSFSIAATNPSQATPLSLGHSMTYTIDASASNGFNGTVALSVSGLPAGVTASFSPQSITTSSLGSSTLTLTAAYSISTYIRNSAVTITGTSGGSAQSAIISLSVQPLQYRGYCGVQ
jgi:hypothetical protein